MFSCAPFHVFCLRHTVRMRSGVLTQDPVWKLDESESSQMVSEKWNEHNLMYIYHKQCEIMQKIQRISSNGQFHCFHYVRKRAPCWNDLFLMETRKTKTHFSQCFSPVWPKRGTSWESWRPENSENFVVFLFLKVSKKWVQNWWWQLSGEGLKIPFLLLMEIFC